MFPAGRIAALLGVLSLGAGAGAPGRLRGALIRGPPDKPGSERGGSGPVPDIRRP